MGSDGRSQRCGGPRQGRAIEADHFLFGEAIALDQGVAGSPVALFVVFEPFEQEALGVGFAFERCLNFLPQRQRRREVFDG